MMALHRKFFIETNGASGTIASYLAAMKHDARALTLKYISGISHEELEWQPYDGWNSVAALLEHIMACDLYFNAVFIEGRSLTAEEEEQITPGLKLGAHLKDIKVKPVQHYQQWLTSSCDNFKRAIEKITDEEFLTRRFEDYDEVNGSDLAWILFHAVEDEIHHRGQISIIRKLYKEMNAKK